MLQKAFNYVLLYTCILEPTEGDYDKGVASSIRYKDRLNKVLNKEEAEKGKKTIVPSPELDKEPKLDNIPDLNKIEKVTTEENPYYC